jgi:hypothetical protein
MNEQNPKQAQDVVSNEEPVVRLTVETPTDLKAGRPWLPPCRCEGCCTNGGCADGS